MLVEGFVLAAQLPVHAEIPSRRIAEGPQQAQVELPAQRQANQRVEQHVILSRAEGKVRHPEIKPETDPSSVSQPESQPGPAQLGRRAGHRGASDLDPEMERSEEHTSELQSPCNL